MKEVVEDMRRRVPEQKVDRNVVLGFKECGVRHELKNLNSLANPMVYPLLFSRGE